MSPTTPLPLRLLRAARGTGLAGLALLLLSLWFAAAAFAQNGTLAGVVVDSETGETLIGVNVIVEELGTGAATGLDGDFRIPGVPAGSYTVAFSYLGYTSQRVTGVEVAAGETTNLDVALAEEALELEGGGEVVVEAEALLNNEAGLLRQRQRASAVSDAISAEAISRSGSSDAADAMERVTGASVVGGKYVYVRGLGDRYANTQLNGAQLPTADPDRRAVQFDLFPSNLLENIVTLKTFTADKPGNFSGGLVDIATKSLPEAFDLRLSASTGVNTQAHFADGFLTDPGGTNWLAMSNGARDLPDLVADPDVEIPSLMDTRSDPEAAARLDAISRAFDAPMNVEAGGAPVNQSYALSLGDRRPLGGGALGYILSLNYNRSASFYDDGTTARYDASGTDPETGERLLSPQSLLSDSRGVSEVSWGGIANATYRLSARHEIGVNSLYSRSGESEARQQVGRLPGISNEDDFLFVDRALLYVERDLYSFQLRGRHQFPGLLGAEVEWLGTLSETTLDEPDLRFFANNRRGEAGEYTFGADLAQIQGQTRFFRTTEEGLRGAQLDVTLPVPFLGAGGQFKLGGRYDATGRDAVERQFLIESNNREPVVLEAGADSLGNVDGYLDQLGIIGEDDNGAPVFGNYVRELRTPFVQDNNYDGALDVPAVYAMTEIAPLPRLRLILGARYEATRQDVASQRLDPEALSEGDSVRVGGRIETDDVLPSANLVYALTDRMNLRAAATRTLARPTFLEFAPGCRKSFALGELICGNPELERSLITNLDLRWEWFTAPGELLAISGYYKQIANPIELAFLNTNGQLKYRNVEQADIYGVEFEVRQRFGRLAPTLAEVPVLGNLAAGLNLSFVQSSIAIDSLELAQRRAIDPEADDRRALQGQSPFLVNADLAYDNLESGTNVGLYLNVFGRRLSRVSSGLVPDVYEQPSPQLDLTASQQVFGDWSVKLSVKNLLGSRYREVYDARLADGDFAPYQEYDRGHSISLGISFNPRFGGGPPPSVPVPSSDTLN